MPRNVTLALVDGLGAPLGVLPTFEVEVTWWPETAELVARAREQFGIDVTVLRILAVEPGRHHGGEVTYLAEAGDIPPAYAGPVAADLSSHPARAAYAEPGGPAASLRWAAARLRDQGLGQVTAAVQHRTWNLSTIWRLETPTGPAWLKQVPRFFWHEVVVLRWLAGLGRTTVPVLLAGQDGRMLLADIPGDDLHDGPAPVRAEIADDHHQLQAASVDQVPHLIDLGVPDQRADRLIGKVAAVAARYGGDEDRLRELVGGLPERMARVASCGMPDALVHGDLHPGNVRSDGRHRVIIDWGDSFIGHPAFDIIRLTGALDAASARPIIDAWAARWRTTSPGCQPERALALLRPVADLRDAAVYASFLDHIEPAEHPYHADDVTTALQQAARSFAVEPETAGEGAADPSLT